MGNLPGHARDHGDGAIPGQAHCRVRAALSRRPVGMLSPGLTRSVSMPVGVALGKAPPPCRVQPRGKARADRQPAQPAQDPANSNALLILFVEASFDQAPKSRQGVGSIQPGGPQLKDRAFTGAQHHEPHD